MGFLTALLERRSTYANLSTTDLLGGNTYTGVRVSEEGSLRSTAVYACVRIISESIASLPLVLFRRQGRSKRKATEHPLYPVLHDLANPEMTAFEWREFSLSKALLFGNAYSEIVYTSGGDVAGLWPLLPDKMEDITRDRQGMPLYHYRRPDNVLVALPHYKIHHLRGLSGNGVLGYSPIRTAMQAVGLSLATEEFGSRFFGMGARMSGVLRHPGALSDGAYKRLQATFTAENAGLSNAHRVKILEEGMEWQQLTIPPEEAQFLETRKFQVTEIARIFRVPPHMLADLERATFSNIEHQSLEFVMHTLRPWLVRHEQAITRDLLAQDERANIYPKYVVEGLLRGDTASRYQGYSQAIANGWMNRNEVRELEDMNPAANLDEYLIPLNMIEAGMEPPQASPRLAGYTHDGLIVRAEVEPAEAMSRRATQTRDGRQAIMRRNVRLFEDAIGRLVKREVADIRRALPKYLGKRSTADFLDWLTSFYQELRQVVPSYLDALMLTYAEQIMESVGIELGEPPTELTDELRDWIAEYLDNFAAVYAVGSDKQIRAIVAEEPEDVEAAIAERMDGWEATKAAKSGLQQAFEAGNALAIFGYTASRVEYLVWAARGESCPLCQSLDGNRIPIRGAFVEEGQTVTAEGVDPLPIVRTMRHGPLHGGCDCVVVAG